MLNSGNEMETGVLCLSLLSAGKLYKVHSHTEGASRMQGFVVKQIFSGRPLALNLKLKGDL